MFQTSVLKNNGQSTKDSQNYPMAQNQHNNSDGPIGGYQSGIH